MAATLTVVFAITASPDSFLVGMATAVLFLAAGLFFVGTYVREDRRFCLHLFTAAFLARFSFAVGLLCVMTWAGVTQLEGGKDYLSYEAAGWRLADNWRAGDLVFNVADPDPGYYFTVAGVYLFTGRYQLAPTLLNALFGGLAAVVVFLLGRETFDRRTGVTAGLFAAFIPNLLFWSSLLYKDTIMSFAVAWAFLLGVRLGRERTRANAIYLAFALVPLFVMRPETAVTVGVAVGVLVLWSGGVRVRRVLSVTAAVGGVVLLLAGLEAAGMGGKRGFVERFVNPVTLLTVHREGWGDVFGQQVTGFSAALYGRNLLLAPHLLLVATAMPFMLPIPGSGELGMNFATFQLPGQLVWLPLLPAIGYGGLWVLRNRTPERVVMLVFVVASAVGIALAGYFTNPRYLVSVVPLLLIFGAVGVRELSRWWAYYGLSLCAGATIVLGYLVVRGV